MLRLSDGLSPEKIEGEVKAYASEHALTHLWWGGLREALYSSPDGYLACKYRRGSGHSPYSLDIKHFTTREDAETLLADDLDEGNILVPVNELEWAKYSFDVWSSDAGTRLRLFDAGNNACPICLRMFSKNDVEIGSSVVLAHIPLRTFAMDESVEACLTCKDCHELGVEPAVASQLIRTRAQLEVGGAVLQADMEVEEDGTLNAKIREHHDTVRARAHRKAMSKGENMTLTFTAPRNPRAAMVTWLKLSYLSVFSLLGVYGYRYAKGAALERVREQILKPDDEIIRHFAVKSSEDTELSGILMNHRDTQCWAVIMSGIAVLLPRGWDTSFYDNIDDDWVAKGSLGGGPLWFPAKFGSVASGSITFKEGVDLSQLVGKDRLFGAPGRVEKEGRKSEFIIVDWNGRDVTTLGVERLS